MELILELKDISFALTNSKQSTQVSSVSTTSWDPAQYDPDGRADWNGERYARPYPYVMPVVSQR